MRRSLFALMLLCGAAAAVAFLVSIRLHNSSPGRRRGAWQQRGRRAPSLEEVQVVRPPRRVSPASRDGAVRTGVRGPSPSGGETVRVRPDVSPTAAAAAVQIARDLAPALLDKELRQVTVVAQKRLPPAVVVRFVDTLSLSGIEAAVAPKSAWSLAQRRLGRDQIRLLQDGNALHAQGAREVGVRASQSFENRPWVEDADVVMDSTGFVVMGTRPGDKHDVTLCVGRSDPCPTPEEAETEASARVQAAVEHAVWRQLGGEWPGKPVSAADVEIPLHVLPSKPEWFAQRLDLSSVDEPMHRAYAVWRLRAADAARLTRYVEGQCLGPGWLYFIKAGGIVAATLLVLVARQIARSRSADRRTWLVNAASLLAWIGLVSAFAVLL